MHRDPFDVLDSDLDAIRVAVRRDLDARLVAGARIRSLRYGIVTDEWLDSDGTLVSETVMPLSQPIEPQPARPSSAGRRLAAAGR